MYRLVSSMSKSKRSNVKTLACNMWTPNAYWTRCQWYQSGESGGQLICKKWQELIRRWDSERELIVRRYLTRTSKYSQLLNIQHDAGCRQTRQWRREWAWPRGITVTTAPRFSHAPIYCNEVRFEVILPEYHLTTGEFLSLTPSLGVIHCEYRHK